MTLTETLSRVMTSCGGTSSTTVRRPDADHAIDGRKDEDEPGPLGLRQQLAEPEDHAALVLGQDLDRADQIEHDDRAAESAAAESSCMSTSILANDQRESVDRGHANLRALGDGLGCTWPARFRHASRRGQADPARWPSARRPASPIMRRDAGHRRQSLSGNRRAEPAASATAAKPSTTGRTIRRLNCSSGSGESIRIIEPKTRLSRPPAVSRP